MSVLCITLNPAIDMTVVVENLSLGTVNRASTSQSDAAGKGLNSAQILADLGFDVLASGFLGAENASIFEQLFAHRQSIADGQIGHVTDAFVRVSGATRTNIKLVDNGTTTDINGRGFIVNHEDKAALLAKLTELAKDSQMVLVAGSLPQGFEVSDFDALLSALTAVNDKVAVDVSGAALKVALSHRLWLIKPNNDELTEVFQKPAQTLEQQTALLADLPIENIVVSMGEAGVHWFSGAKVYRSLPPKMTVKSTVGAGDTLVAGMMAGLAQNQSAEQTLVRATALSAHAVSIVGFKAATEQQLSQLLPQIQFQDLS